MLHQDTAKQLEAIYKKCGVIKYAKVFQCANGPEFKSDMTKLLENTILKFKFF